MAEPAFHFVSRGQFTGQNPAAVMDVVFVHGLGGDPFKTWSATEDMDGFWPSWLAKDFHTINVWTAGYDSTIFAEAFAGQGSSLHDRATTLLDFLVSHSVGTRPVVFIAHSLGGLIVKQMLRRCSESLKPEHKRLNDAVRAIIFCATPHQGSAAATSVRNVLSKLLSKNVNELAFGDDALLDLNEWFRNWTLKHGVSVLAYYETKKTSGLMIVHKATANPNVVGCDPTAVDTDHIKICKPVTRESHLYVSVKSFIDNLVTGLSSPAKLVTLHPTQLLALPSPQGVVGLPNLTTQNSELGQIPDISLTGNSAAASIQVGELSELLIDYQYYTTQAPHDRRPLAQKLADSGRAFEIREGERKKERFAMSLHRHASQASSITRYTRLMAEVETRFNRHVLPSIARGQDETEINGRVQECVIDPIVSAQPEETDDVTAAVVAGALYYLTGNCHVRWDPEQD